MPASGFEPVGVPSDSPLLLLHPTDNVAVVRRTLKAATRVAVPGGSGQLLTVQQDVPAGHKIAVRPIAEGEPVRKYGHPIGYATCEILVGQWVHSHNVGLGELEQDYEFGTQLVEPPRVVELPRTFLGYQRSNGRVGTRNYVGIVTTVNCSATAARLAAQHFTAERLAEFPNVDGVVAFTHKIGCAMEYGGEGHRVLARTLAGMAVHPNLGACLVIGLGCETCQTNYLLDECGLGCAGFSVSGPRPLVLTIQDCGGLRKTVDRAVGVLRELLPEVNRCRRTPQPLSKLVVGTECGGSDANSGLTANPAVGFAADLLVAHGASVILSEVPELIGAEHLLTRRAISREVGEALLRRIQWWRDYAARNHASLDHNPSFGNRQGGITTIYEKSLGAVAKGGSSPVRAVYEYAEPVTERGLVIMDTPGFDPVSVTGMLAGGAQVIVFTTGRGSCFGSKPAPTIKVATNSDVFRRLSDDMDLDAGRVLDGTPLSEIGQEIFETVIAVASGRRTKSELQGVGDEEFCPWQVGPIF